MFAIPKLCEIELNEAFEKTLFLNGVDGTTGCVILFMKPPVYMTKKPFTNIQFVNRILFEKPINHTTYQLQSTICCRVEK